MPYLQVEFRQDEVANAAGQCRWARRFAVPLAARGNSQIFCQNM
jgi:hypothetical protein